MNDFLPPSQFEMPAGCETCPVQCKISNDFTRLVIEKEVAQHAATRLLGDGSEELVEFFRPLTASEDDARQMTVTLRQTTAEELDDIDEQLDDIQQTSRQLAKSCDKPLKMRATKSGKVYVATLCTSALNYYVNSERTKHTDAHVWVQTPPKE
jgi:hypothetical protein